jgi:hypothetical protein
MIDGGCLRQRTGMNPNTAKVNIPGWSTSAVSQFWLFTCSRVTLPRWTFSRIDSAVAVQTNGFGSSLCTRRYSSIAAISSGTLRRWG